MNAFELGLGSSFDKKAEWWKNVFKSPVAASQAANKARAAKGITNQVGSASAALGRSVISTNRVTRPMQSSILVKSNSAWLPPQAREALQGGLFSPSTARG